MRLKKEKNRGNISKIKREYTHRCRREFRFYITILKMYKKWAIFLENTNKNKFMCRQEFK